MPTAPNISNKTATVGSSFSTTLAAGSGGDTPLSYTASPLPAGLSFNSSTRVISGTPTHRREPPPSPTPFTDDDGDSDIRHFHNHRIGSTRNHHRARRTNFSLVDDSRPRLSQTHMVSRQRRRSNILPGRNTSRDKRRLDKQRNSIERLHPQRTKRRHSIPRASSRHKLCRLVRLLVPGQRDNGRRNNSHHRTTDTNRIIRIPQRNHSNCKLEQFIRSQPLRTAILERYRQHLGQHKQHLHIHKLHTLKSQLRPRLLLHGQSKKQSGPMEQLHPSMQIERTS